MPPGNFKRLPAGKWLQMPGQCFYAIRSAILRRPTVEIVEDGPEVLAARRGLGLYPMTGSGGGIPIWRDGVVIGGIGVGGALPDPDIACAEAALAALADRAS